ncbi:histidinol-phosphate transaminase [Tolypothrix campylonemoides VB511288]|nr:histidinol-phosphate transaminase [Tolypothrix campylonemoides VB511288]
MSASPLSLVREDLRAFAGYKSARTEVVDGAVWLNANESPWANPADEAGAVRRYPDPQPAALRARLAALYGCTPAQLLAGRGSDEGIDLLVRALCRPGGDGIVVTTPTFGMYAVCARLHGVPVADVPLVEGADGFRCDLDAVREAALAAGAKIVFLCSPGNPTGATLPRDGVLALARALDGRALVVVDEAYAEFADAASFVADIAAQRNLAVLRTLSKAHALAAARLGVVIADAELIAVLQRCQAPYPLPTPCVRLVEAGLDDASLEATRARIADVCVERERLADALSHAPGVRRAYASQANFVLARFADPQRAFDALLAAGIVVRDMRHLPQLGDALRITVGTPEQNARVVDVLRAAALRGAA